MKRFMKKSNNHNKGFTLVELIVTLVVLAIVVSLTTLSILAWQDWADFKKENEYAQTLFVAAQNQLSEYSANGRLLEMQEALSNDEGKYGLGTDSAPGIEIKLDKLIGEDGKAYDPDKVWPESADKADKERYIDTIVALRADAKDYNSYLANPVAFKSSKPEAYWVFELISAYVYDLSILNDGAICLEITPEDGQVFSVLYSDKNTRFVYLSLEAGKGESVEKGVAVSNIDTREELYRRDRMVGYYGVDTLSKATKNIGKAGTASIINPMLHNEETLNLEFEIEEGELGRLTYQIDLVSENDDKPHLTLNIDGSEIKNKENMSPVSAEVLRYTYEGGVQTKESIGNFKVLCWSESSSFADNPVVRVILDAADLQAQSKLYENNLPTILSVNASTAQFANTYSYFRFGVPVDDIYCNITASGVGYKTSDTVRSNTENSCYQTGSETGTGAGVEYAYTIDNARHLYNVRYIEDISYEKQKDVEKNNIASVNFIVHSDIDWEAFCKSVSEYNKLYNTYGATGYINIGSINIDGKAMSVTNSAFPSIAQLRERDKITGEATGISRTISGIGMYEHANSAFGIYSLATGNMTDANNRPVGLVNVSYGEMERLCLDRFTVKGRNFVGGFCGINAGSIDQLSTLSSNHKSIVSGLENVGGVIGFQMPISEEVVLQNLLNRATVEGKEAVGGIVGMVRNDFQGLGINWTTMGFPQNKWSVLTDSSNFKILVQNCENYGPVQGLNNLKADEVRYIGGIAGYTYNKYTGADETNKIRIEKCTSSPQYEDVVLASIQGQINSDCEKLDNAVTSGINVLNGVYVGGIVGYNHYGEINSCYTTPEKGTEGFLFGYKYVGGIVGLNLGPASGIVGGEAKQGINSNNVVAYDYAGGITGCSASVKDIDSKNINISGEGRKDPAKLEGILIPSEGRSLHVKVDNWTNKGVVVAVHEYAGGITGYNAGWIYRCNSQIAQGQATNFFDVVHTGNYAGGVAGYNNGVIGNTDRNIAANGVDTTKNGTGSNISTICYVLGNNYVGGVVGYNDVDAIVEDYTVTGGYVHSEEGGCFTGGYVGFNASIDLIMDTETKEARSIKCNPTDVKGDYFVGGIIGGNIINTNGVVATGGSDDVSGEVYAVFTLRKNNKKVHFSIEIVNGTSGAIDNWSVPVNFGGLKVDVNGSNGNGAKLRYDSSIGAFVASSDRNSTIRANNSFTQNGTLEGSASELDSFVAAFNGLKLPVQYTSSGSATPGGSTTPGTGLEIEKLYAIFETDNFLGNLEGKAFIGGFVGFNMLLDSEEAGTVMDVQESVVKAFNESDEGNINFAKYGIFPENTTENDDNQNKLRQKVIIVDNIYEVVRTNSTAEYDASTVVMEMTGKNNGKTRNSLSIIRGDLVVGGVLGYNESETELYIKNIENATPVVANVAIEHPEEQVIVKNNVSELRKTNYAGDDYIYTYSYAGGIIGKVSASTTVDACSNIGLASVTSKGTYTGGLCEINEGHVINCAVITMGNSNKDYIGGICGLNKAIGVVSECRMVSQTISGRNVVGGIVAENFGEISEITFSNAKTAATGNMVSRDDESVKDGVTGLYAAYNGITGMLVIENDINKVSIKSGGQFAGLVTGYNSGSIYNAKTGDPDETRTNNLELRGTIEGYRAVGALCGCNDDQDVDHIVANYTNYATVKTSMGQAGGIIGINISKNTIEYCENRALVIATDGGNCGGITSINDSLITECYDFAEVTAPNGMCGGIVSLNDKNGTITKCYVESLNAAPLTFSSNYVVGGIAAQNAGLIENNYLKNVTITNNIRRTGTLMGIVCGENLITGRIFLADTLAVTENNERAEVENCKVRAESNNCKLGGIAGSNAGLIQGAVDEKDTAKITSVIDCNLEFGTAIFGSMGGVAGYNVGRIDHVSVDGKIDGLNGDPNNGYGGIAGFSGYTSKDKYNLAKTEYESLVGPVDGPLVSITNCTFDGSVHAVGSSGTMAEIGGITGYNGIGSVITKCYIGVRDDKALISSGNETVISAGNINRDYTLDGTDKLSGSHIGGIAGTNRGQITDCDNNKYSKDNVSIIAFAGDAGGITGVNDRGGIVSGYNENGVIYKVTTGKSWSLDMRCSENNHGPGGIIGRNESGHDIEYVDNFCSVTCKYQANVKVGGFVGSNQQKEVGQVTFRYCNNFGDVTGYGCSGGFMGQEWFRGCIFDHCINYGAITLYEESDAKQRYVGGFIGSFKASNTDLSFNSCANHGKIHCNTYKPDKANYFSISGFLGYMDDDMSISGYMNDCVNTGIIEYTDPAAEKTFNASAFVSEPNSNMNWYLTLCRNYNTNVPSVYVDPKTLLPSNGGFISKGKGGKLILKDCLDVSNLKASGTTPNQIYAPFGDSLNGNSTNNYYVDINSATVTTNFDDASHGAYFSANKGTNGDNWAVYCGTDSFKYSSYRAYERLFTEPSLENRIKADANHPLNIKLTPDSSFAGMSSFVMYLWNGNNDPMNTSKPEQRFNVIFVDKDGNRFEAAVSDVATNLECGEFIDANGKKWIKVLSPTVGTSPTGILANRVEVKVPAGCNPGDIRNILLHNSNTLYIYGFGWVPSDGTNGKDSVLLTGLSKKNGIYVNNLNFKNNNGSGTASLEIKVKEESYNGYQYKYDMLNWNMYKNFFPGERIRIDTGGTVDVMVNSVKVKESKIGVVDFDIVNTGDYGINKLHFYLTNDANCNAETLSTVAYYYEYGYKLTDVNGTVCLVAVSDENRVDNVTGIRDVVVDIAGLVAGGKLTSPQLSKVEFYIKNVGIGGFYNNKANAYVYVAGVTYESTDGSGEQMFASGDLDLAATYSTNRNAMTQTGAYSIHRLITDYSTHGGTATVPYVHADYDVDRGFNMDANDPINTRYLEDHEKINKFNYVPTSDYADAENREGLVFDSNNNATLVSGVTNSRISVYYDIDPKFVDMIKNMYSSKVKLQTPTNPEATDNHGYINFSWDRVSKDVLGKPATPYGYEILFVVKDEAGAVVEEKTVFQLEQSKQNRQKLNSLIEIEEDWYVNGYTVYISVLAVNGARYTEGTTEYDSEPTEPVVISPTKFRLITPRAHLEMTEDNRMRAILDNYEDYLEEKVTIQDAAGNDVEVSMADVCQIKVSYSGYTGDELSSGTPTQGIMFTIIPSDGNIISEESLIVRSKDGNKVLGFNLLESYAEPLPEYVDAAYTSPSYNTKGNGYGNDMISLNDKYANANFDGFFGESADAMTYQVRIVGGDDSYITVDIGSFDENIGTYVYSGNYGQGALHIGGSDGAGTVTASSQVSGIPTEWFAADFNSRLEAREFLQYSQQKIIHYGHETATNIELNGTLEENQAVLAGIRDPYFLAESGVIKDYPICDGVNLKPGYVIYRNSSGTYDIWYYPAIALSKKEAADFNVANGTDLREYRRFCVDTVVYEPMKGADISYTNKFTVPGDNYVNLTDYQESYWMRRQIDTSTNANAASGITAYKNYAYKDKMYNAVNQIQTWFPAPLADDVTGDGKILITTSDSGAKTYKVSWDTFYRDNYCWNQGAATSTNQKYPSEDIKYISMFGLGDNADLDIPTWKSFREKTGIYEDFINDLAVNPTTDRRKWVNAMMNAYYFTYVNAKYDVYMIGTTFDGTDVILEKKTVDTPVALPTVNGTTYKVKIDNNNKPTSVITVTDPKYDMWNYSCSFTDAAGNWEQYKTIKVRIMRLGANQSINLNGGHIKDGTTVGVSLKRYAGIVGSDGTIGTFELPRYVDYEISQKQKLEKLSPPSAVHIATNLDYPEYKISWGTIIDEKQKKDLGGYLLTIKDNDEENPVPSKYYLVESLYDAGCTLTKANIAFAVDDEDADRIETVEGTFDENICSLNLDLSDYAGKNIVVTVRAVARDDVTVNPTDYTHGDESDECPEFTVFSSLEVPEVADLVIVVEDDKNSGSIKAVQGSPFGMHNFETAEYVDESDAENPVAHPNTVTKEEYEKGFVLNYTNESEKFVNDYDAALIYKIVAAVSVYDERQDSDVSQNSSGDEPEIGGSGTYWNTGAEDVLYTKENPLVIADATVDPVNWTSAIPYDVLSAKYAGKYLKLVLKATSESSIDSSWTDEDIAENATVNYVWIHVPKLMTELDVTDVVINGPDAGTADTLRLTFTPNGVFDSYAVKMNIETDKNSSDLSETVINVVKTVDEFDNVKWSVESTDSAVVIEDDAVNNRIRISGKLSGQFRVDSSSGAEKLILDLAIEKYDDTSEENHLYRVHDAIVSLSDDSQRDYFDFEDLEIKDLDEHWHIVPSSGTSSYNPGGGEEGTPEPGGGEEGTPEPGGGEEGTPEPGGGEEGTPTPGGGEEGTPTPGGGEEGTPTPGGGEEGTPTPGGGEEGTPTPGGSGSNDGGSEPDGGGSASSNQSDNNG